MFSKFKHKIKNKNEILALTFLIIITIISTSYYNYSQKIIKDNYNDTINNIYFKKTVNHFLDKLKKENYDRYSFDGVVSWWKNKASKRYESLLSDGRLRTELETWNCADDIDIIR